MIAMLRAGPSPSRTSSGSVIGGVSAANQTQVAGLESTGGRPSSSSGGSLDGDDHVGCGDRAEPGGDRAGTDGGDGGVEVDGVGRQACGQLGGDLAHAVRRDDGLGAKSCCSTTSNMRLEVDSVGSSWMPPTKGRKKRSIMASL